MMVPMHPGLGEGGSGPWEGPLAYLCSPWHGQGGSPLPPASGALRSGPSLALADSRCLLTTLHRAGLIPGNPVGLGSPVMLSVGTWPH